MEFTKRQQNEIEYHVEHSLRLRKRSAPLSHEVIYAKRRKWWNHYWVVYSELLNANVHGWVALVPGCGSGTDAIRLAKMGAKVFANDLSLEMLSLAQASSEREGVRCDFRHMSLEGLDYPDDTFEVVFIRDLLHHCDVPAALEAVRRVSRAGALILIDELYTHTELQEVRESAAGRWLYRRFTAERLRTSHRTSARSISKNSP